MKANESIAVVGATGAGKSTLVSLLLRRYDVTSGSIKLNGSDIRDLSLEELRCRIALVPQDVFIFADTIRENIRLHNPTITDDQVEAAAKHVNADKLIQK